MKAPLQPAKSADTAAPAQRISTPVEALVDNRPQATVQRELQDVIENSPRQVAQRAAVAAINNSPRMVAQRQAAAQLQARPNRTGLPDKLKAGVENLSGHSLDDVRVHYNSAKPAQLQAHAYAQGTDIHIGPGQEKHLPHEAWHVVQQKQGRVRATIQLKGFTINDENNLEHEAEGIDNKIKNSIDSDSLVKHVDINTSIIQGYFTYKGKKLLSLRAEVEQLLAGRANFEESLSDYEVNHSDSAPHDFISWASKNLSNNKLLESDEEMKDSEGQHALNSLENKLKEGHAHEATSSAVGASEIEISNSTSQPDLEEKKKTEETLKKYGEKETYLAFQKYLEEIDASSLKGVEKQEAKVELLKEFHGHLKELSLSELQNFGIQLHASIKKHDENDTIEKAFSQNRAIFRSWHPAGRVSKSDNLGAMVEGGRELVGVDQLNVVLKPNSLMKYKAKAKEEKMPVIDAVPASLLHHGETNTVFNTERGTVTTLLPENLYAGFTAYNEAVKELLRKKSPEELSVGEQKLKDNTKRLRAFVTRPVFFDNGDIQSSTGAYKHAEKPGLHVRKTHFALGYEDNPLRKNLAQKLVDPLRRNAIFYQTFTNHSKTAHETKQWNEMVVKYRQTGKTVSTSEGHDETAKLSVPGLESHAIGKKLTNSGKFDEDHAKNENAEFVKSLTAKFAEELAKEKSVTQKDKKHSKHKH